MGYILNTYERVAAWHAVQEKLTMPQIAERIGCSLSSVHNWVKKDPHYLQVNKAHHDAFVALLEDFMEGIRVPGMPPSSDMPLEPVVEKTEPQRVEIPKTLGGDHCVEIPVFEKEVILIDLIDQELRHLSAERLISVYRAILSKVL